MQDDGEVVASRIVQFGQPRRRALRHEQGLERPGRPERHDDQPLVGLDDDPLAPRLMVDIVEQHPPPGRRQVGPLRRVLALTRVRPNLCQSSWSARTAGTLQTGSRRLSIDGRSLHHYSGISAFAERAVVVPSSVVRIDPDVPPEVAAIFGSR